MSKDKTCCEMCMKNPPMKYRKTCQTCRDMELMWELLDEGTQYRYLEKFKKDLNEEGKYARSTSAKSKRLGYSE